MRIQIKLLLLFLLFTIPNQITAQLVTTTGLTANQLASILAGPGVQISNAIITSPSNYYSSFNGATTNLGIASGILLTTGDGNIAVGPNNLAGAASNDNNPGDNDLENLTGTPTFDAAVLEFDFVPQNDTIKFRYVFASEEYPEYVCSLFNDLFAFFISGPGIAGVQNIALIPGTNIPVAINSVNNGTQGSFADPGANCNLSYPTFYVDNTGGSTIQYDGFTTVLTAMAIVVPCQTYHLKIAIADSKDADYDSGVFLEAGSLSSTPIVYAGNDGSYCTGTAQQIGLAPVSGWTYSWNPTTGLSNPNIGNPTVTLINNGSSVITTAYTLTASNGTCTLTDTVLLSTIPTPTASISSSQNICEGDTITIQYTGNGSTSANYAWDFGGGNVIFGNGQGPYIVSYPNGGKYLTSLTINYFNCPSANAIDTVDVFDFPLARFIGPNQVCTGVNTTFVFNGVNPPGSIANWNISGGSPASSNSIGPVNASFITAGYHVINLTIDNNGCSSNYQDSILVNPTPLASVSGTPNLCSNDTFQVNFNGTANAGAVYLWNLNGATYNGGTGAGPINFINSIPGNDSIILVVADQGCRDTAVFNYQVIEQPLASFVTIPEICLKDSALLVFDGNAPVGSTITWLLPSSSQQNATGDSIFITYFNPNKYAINLTVNNNGCISNKSDSILVNSLPLVSITANNVCNDTPVTIVNNSTIATGNISSSYWNFGDGQTSNLLSPTNHNYSSPGTYTINYIATSNKLCKDSISKRVEVYEMPISDFISDSVCEGNSTNIQSASSVGSGSIMNWEFSFNSQIIGLDSSIQYLFPCNGTHEVMHVVTTNNGCRDTIFDNVLVYSNPVVNFTGGPLNGCQPLDVSFQNLTTNIDGSIDTLIWNFGDGNASSLNTTNHIYEDAGFYDVALEAISTNGCSSDTTFRNYVEVYQNPEAFFVHEPSPTDILSPVIYFKNQSLNANYYNWNLGDGNLSNESDPIHQYEAAGNYPIQLIASAINGCKDTVYGEVIVNPAYTLYVPNTFTPNNDGRNDVFLCSGIGIVNFKMSIFSRWGNHICTLNDINQSWDGYDDGKLSQEDTYIYLIEVIDVLKQKHTVSGRVSIIK